MSETNSRRIYKVELEKEFHRVMLSNAVATYGYDTAKSFGLDEMWQLKAAIVALANAHDKLLDRSGDYGLPTAEQEG